MAVQLGKRWKKQACVEKIKLITQVSPKGKPDEADTIKIEV